MEFIFSYLFFRTRSAFRILWRIQDSTKWKKKSQGLFSSFSVSCMSLASSLPLRSIVSCLFLSPNLTGASEILLTCEKQRFNLSIWPMVSKARLEGNHVFKQNIHCISILKRNSMGLLTIFSYFNNILRENILYILNLIGLEI